MLHATRTVEHAVGLEYQSVLHAPRTEEHCRTGEHAVGLEQQSVLHATRTEEHAVGLE